VWFWLIGLMVSPAAVATDFYVALDTGLLILEIRLVGLAAERDGRPMLVPG